MTTAKTQAITHECLHPKSKDGTQLFAHQWTPIEKPVVAQVLILHGYTDHGGRYRELAHALANHGIASTALDYRGHGNAKGQRGYVDHFGQYRDDAEAGYALLDEALPRFVLAHSNGATIALDCLTSCPDRFDGLAGLVVTNPNLALEMQIPAIKRWLGHTAASIYPKLALPTGISSTYLTHDENLIAQHERDPLVFRTATAGWFRANEAAQTRVRAHRQLATSLLYIYSDADPIASPEANAAFSKALTCDDKTIWVRINELHEVLHETHRAKLHQNIALWITTRAQKAS